MLLLTRLAAVASQPKPLDTITPVLKGLVRVGAGAWPLLLLFGAAVLVRLAYRLYRLRRLSRSGIDEIDHMDGRTFEVFLSTLFSRLGYRVELTRYRGDYGADLVVAKNGWKTVVQAKRWSKKVGIKAVQEAAAAKATYRCDAGLVVTNQEFTQQARRLARANEVELWDRRALVSKLLVAGGAKMGASRDEAAVPSPALAAGAHRVATCVTCGNAVSVNVRDYCLAHPERFGGRIYCFRHQRSVRPVLAE
jgi:restriction system protein